MTVRTKRRYAHELYPHPEEGEVRPLSVEVPYLYARAAGSTPKGTGWHKAPWKTDEWAKTASHHHILLLIEARHKALLADALLQGMAGDEAWAWAEQRMDEAGEWIYERATHYGVDPKRIKPYPCGPDPDYHDHESEPDARGWSTVTRVEGRESECPDCTEETSLEEA